MDNENNDELLTRQSLPEITVVPAKTGIAAAKAGTNDRPGAPIPKPENIYTLTIDYAYPWN